VNARADLDAQALAVFDARLLFKNARIETPVLVALEDYVVVWTHSHAGAALRAEFITDDRIDVEPIRIKMTTHGSFL
jgi:hypothetical protein